MKKILCILLALIVVFAFSSCGEKKTEEKPLEKKEDVKEETEKLDVDLTALSSTMVYSEVYNMMNEPDGYMGKKVKMRGNFSVYEDEATGNVYFACLIADATACCSQGIEFVLTDERKYPDDYPEIGTEITVTGTFGTYYEGEYMYCRLSDATMS